MDVKISVFNTLVEAIIYLLLYSLFGCTFPLISFDIPWKHQKTSGFLMFSRGIKRDQWYEMV